MHEVIYEDLAARPTETAAGVLRFLGLLPTGSSSGGASSSGSDAAGGRLQPLKETTKQSTAPLSEGVENWEEVVRATRAVPWQ